MVIIYVVRSGVKNGKIEGEGEGLRANLCQNVEICYLDRGIQDGVTGTGLSFKLRE
ncbi:hypothetical protein ACIQ4Z_14945 [Peribacillus asahii]|uniref:hypothetical protein n=1 Tax=Peribacillus asahii TaxID=228899 RepID=UPI003823272D